MIKIGNTPVTVEHFPDGTQRINDFPIGGIVSGGAFKIANITWQYENDEELVSLMYVVGHLRDFFGDKFITINLKLPYIPNARMDRVHDPKSECFTLKHFCRFINSLNFDSVEVCCPHSDVAVALIDRCTVVMLPYFNNAVDSVTKEFKMRKRNVIIYFPDAGAMKRFSSLPCMKGYSFCYGEKVREWNTGRINGLKIHLPDTIASLDERVVMIVDDIVSYGGTLAYSADELKKMGAKHVAAYVPHVENSVLDKENGTLLKRLEDGTVDRLYTLKNSIFTLEHERITKI